MGGPVLLPYCSRSEREWVTVGSMPSLRLPVTGRGKYATSSTACAVAQCTVRSMIVLQMLACAPGTRTDPGRAGIPRPHVPLPCLVDGTQEVGIVVVDTDEMSENAESGSTPSARSRSHHTAVSSRQWPGVYCRQQCTSFFLLKKRGLWALAKQKIQFTRK